MTDGWETVRSESESDKWKGRFLMYRLVDDSLYTECNRLFPHFPSFCVRRLLAR